MAKLTYSQLEGTWIQAGGLVMLAPLMAAIALAESGGDPNSRNDKDNGGKQSSFGLWQISTGTHAAPASNWNDPLTNAKLAVGKYKSQGLKAWGTYTSGAYKPFLKSGVPASNWDPAVDGALGFTSGTTLPGTVTTSEAGATCAWHLKFLTTDSCVLSKPQARVLLGITIGGTAILIGLFGLVILASYGLKGNASLVTSMAGGMRRGAPAS